jgi:hemerythrin superfamily protein
MPIEGNFTTGAKADAIEVITTDHREVEQLFVLIQATDGVNDLDIRADLAQRIADDLTLHTSIEERVLYPAVRRFVDDGDTLVEEAEKDHQEIRNLIAEVRELAPDADDFVAAFGRLQQTVAHHVQEEERTLLPQFKESVSGEMLYELGDALIGAKQRS